MKKPSRNGSRDAVAYARVSTVEQAERDLSLRAQLEAIRGYAKDRGFNLVNEFVERGVTGTDDNRPQFQRMLGQVTLSGSTVSTILVLASSRFMRNAERARFWKEKLRHQGIRVVAIQQETTDDANGRFTEGIFELVDQLESEQNGMRTRAAMRENARRGFFNGSAPPFGYRIIKVPGPGGEPKNKLEVDEGEAELVREVFRRYVSGSGAKSVARSLNQRGLKYRERLWTRDRVLHTIEETAVVGRYYWGRVDSKTGQPHPREEWVAMSVPPIVDDELFALAKETRARRDPGRNPGRASSSPLLLSGLARCARCGKTLQLVTATGGNGSVHRYYQCRTAARAGVEACRGRRVPVDALDQTVLRTAADALFTANRCSQILRDYVEAEGGLRKRATDERRVLERERNELDRRLAKLYDHLETNPALDELIADRLRDIQARRTEVIRRLGRLTPAGPVPPHLYRAETIERFRARLRGAFLSEDQGIAKAYLHRLISTVTVAEDEIVIDGRTDGVLAMMAGGKAAAPDAVGNLSADVHTHVVGWRPNRDSSMNVANRVVVPFPRRKPRELPEPVLPPVVEQVRLARRWQAELNGGGVKNRAVLARREGVSGMWVAHVLGLLELEPALLEFVENLPAGTPARLLSGRELRRVRHLGSAAQLEVLRRARERLERSTRRVA